MFKNKIIEWTKADSGRIILYIEGIETEELKNIVEKIGKLLTKITKSKINANNNVSCH